MLWAESYRPQVLDDVIGQDHIVKRLKFMIEQLHSSGGDRGFPHLMFAGNAGTGKTSAAMALMRSAFGDDWRSNFMELNASDERSIQVIRTKVKDFARRGVIGQYLVDGKVRQIPFNVIFLDECDNLTPDAQASLRRIMELHSKTTRFILSCNYPHKLIDPVKDRCAFSDTRFRPIAKEDISEALRGVAEREGLDIHPDAIERIGEVSRGSMRKALNTLFATTRVHRPEPDYSKQHSKRLVKLTQPSIGNSPDEWTSRLNLWQNLDSLVQTFWIQFSEHVRQTTKCLWQSNARYSVQ